MSDENSLLTSDRFKAAPMLVVRIDKIIYIVLDDGEEYEYQTGGNTEEGFDINYFCYKREGKMLTLTIDRNARDCDGPLSTTTTLVWPVNGPVNEHGYPIWDYET